MLRLESHGQVAVITLDRPPANAQSRSFFVELNGLFTWVAEPDVRAVVLTGTGRFFSAGIDLFELLTYDDAEFAEFAAAFDAAFLELFALPKPLIAAINGHAIAGGAVLAATADFRLMAEGDGRVGLTEIQVGVAFPASALEPVRFSCAGPHLHELLYRGLTYPPHEAQARRLVDEVVPADELMPRALALAAELAEHSPATFSAMKRALRAESLARVKAARASGRDPMWATWRTPETRASIEAYRKRAVRRRG
jgi:enoyl-CoA hydratase